MGPLGKEKASHVPSSCFLVVGGVGWCRQICFLPGLTNCVNGYESVATTFGTAEISNASAQLLLTAFILTPKHPLGFLIHRVRAIKYFQRIPVTEERRVCVHVCCVNCLNSLESSALPNRASGLVLRNSHTYWYGIIPKLTTLLFSLCMSSLQCSFTAASFKANHVC